MLSLTIVAIILIQCFVRLWGSLGFSAISGSSILHQHFYLISTPPDIHNLGRSRLMQVWVGLTKSEWSFSNQEFVFHSRNSNSRNFQWRRCVKSLQSISIYVMNLSNMIFYRFGSVGVVQHLFNLSNVSGLSLVNGEIHVVRALLFSAPTGLELGLVRVYWISGC